MVENMLHWSFPDESKLVVVVMHAWVLLLLLDFVHSIGGHLCENYSIYAL